MADASTGEPAGTAPPGAQSEITSRCQPTRHLRDTQDGQAGFAGEVLGEIEGNEGNFDHGLWVQEVINAVEISHERRWVSLPLDAGLGATEGQAR